jgi:hypothetical protein
MMDNEVKQLRAQADEWAQYAAKNLFHPNARENNDEIFTFIAILRTHFVFPNLHADERTVLQALDALHGTLEMTVNASPLPKPEEKAMLEAMISQFEREFADLKQSYEVAIEPKLTELQRRYVAQTVLNVPFQ